MSIDITNKLEYLPIFIPKEDEISSSKQRELLYELLEREETEVFIEKQNKPKYLFMFYTTYRRNEEYDYIFNRLLKFNDENFYHFVVNHLTTTVITSSTVSNYKVLHLDQIKINEKYIKQLHQKIDQLEEDKKNEIHKYIESGKEW